MEPGWGREDTVKARESGLGRGRTNRTSWESVDRWTEGRGAGAARPEARARPRARAVVASAGGGG